MADDPSSTSPTPDTPPPRTTGGGFRWEPPTAEELQNLMPGYTIEKILGRGGMGAVYRGVQTNLDRPVAIKILPPGVEKEDPSFAERFKSEARLMAKLNHPAVVAVYDFGTTAAGQLYFAMEYVDGSDVSQMIAAQGRLPPDHALAITAHVCDALSAAHELGIVHRDIKPANVLINMKGQVKVADFGLAKIEDPGQHGLTKTGYAMGTPDFVAPEALTLGAAIDGRADLYAVGVMLYQMLTGNIPRGAFKPASVLVPGLDPRYDPIIVKAMQHDRAERHQSAAELRRELDVILTVPFVRNDAPASAAIPVAQMAQAPGQRSAAQKPVGKPPQPKSTMDTPVRRDAAPAGNAHGTSPAPKSKTPLFIGLGVAAAIGIGAVVMFSGGKKTSPPAAVGDSAPPAKPTSVASSTPKPAASALPTPKPTTASTQSVSSSPRLLVSASSDKFPSGQWVKLFTKAEDLPENLRKSGVTFEDGWIRFGEKQRILKIPNSDAANFAVRARFLRGSTKDNNRIVLRGNEGQPQYQIGYAGNSNYSINKLAIQRWVRMGEASTLGNIEVSVPAPGNDYSLEFAAIGSRLIGRFGDSILKMASDDSLKRGEAHIYGAEDLRDIEVMNLDGLSEAEALKILGVDEKGNDLRKPAAVASATPTPPVSKSPPLRVPASSDKFPPGQWVKVFTKFEDLPEELRKGNFSLKWEEGWMRCEIGKPVRIYAVESLSNYAIRATMQRQGKEYQNKRLVIRAAPKPSIEGYMLRLDSTTLSAGRTVDGSVDGDDLWKAVSPVIQLPRIGEEYTLEWGCVGDKLIGRLGKDFVKVVTDTTRKSGQGYFTGGEPIRDIEVINLDGLSEAEALKILGVDEKGNDTRAAAVAQEKQAMEQAKVVDAASAIPELKVLHDQFVKLTAERVTAPFEADVAKLNAGYIGGIDRKITEEKAAGHLDGIIALEAEKKLLADKQPIPSDDAEGTTANLKALRTIYRAAYAKIEATRVANLKQLTDPLTLRLKQLEADLTKKDRVPDAKTVREYREALGKEGSADIPSGAAQPVRSATNGGAASTTTDAGKSARAPLKKFPPGDDRKAAEWVLSVGGTLNIYGDYPRITDAADLPRGRFVVVSVYLEFSADKQPLAPINDLQPLAGLKSLSRLHLKELPLDNAHLEIIPSLPALNTLWTEKTGIGDSVFALLASSPLQSLQFKVEPKITCEGISALRSCKELVALHLHGCQPTEEGLRQVGNLEDLTSLTFSNTHQRLQDSHLPLLGRLKKLTFLNLRRTQVTAEGLIASKVWSGLTNLGFDPLPGDAAKQVAGLAAAFPKVDALLIEGDPTWIYNADNLRALKGFPRLRKLTCTGPLYTDEVLSGLLEIDALEELTISNDIKLTDASLGTVAKLRKLKRLEMINCPNLTAAAIAAFKKERPDVTVTK